jgi:hypothetical protein
MSVLAASAVPDIYTPPIPNGNILRTSLKPGFEDINVGSETTGKLNSVAFGFGGFGAGWPHKPPHERRWEQAFCRGKETGVVPPPATSGCW